MGSGRAPGRVSGCWGGGARVEGTREEGGTVAQIRGDGPENDLEQGMTGLSDRLALRCERK